MIHKFSRYLLTLVALFAMTAGAWAEEVTVTFTPADLNGTGIVTKDGVTLTPGNSDARSGANFYHRGSNTFSVDKGTFTKIEIVDCNYVYPDNINGWQKEQTGSYKPYPDDDPWPLYTLTWTGEAESVTFTAAVYEIQSIVFTINKPEVDVTTNKAQGETTFTEATFAMPAYDATVSYELVRDMAISMPVTVGDGEDGYRIRVQKNEQQQFEPAEMQFDAMLALFTVNDEIEEKTLTFYGQTVDCKLSIYAVDENGEPTGDAIAFADLEPGRYVAIATAAEGSAYDGETAPSNIFELYQGYEVEIPAGEMITYYKDEAIYVEDEDVQLFSITAVGENTATATQLDVVPASVPMLVKNNSEETKTVLLIPTETDPLSFTWYEGFVGTLEATTILASDATTDRYAFNGKQFVRVKNDLAVGANKAWLEIPAANNARIINISFEETTGIDEMVNGQSSMVNGTWYDLNGRKLDAVPTKKGVYILNGKKVVVK